MNNIYFLLLSLLCCIIIAAVIWRQRKFIRIVVVFILFLTSLFSVFSLFSFVPRLATSYHERQGKAWSEKFRDGVSAAKAVSEPHYPFLLISSCGLTIIALVKTKKTNNKT